MNGRHHSLWSPAIGAEASVLAYGHYGRPLLAFPSQQGQALLSGLWALVGLATLLAGLVRDRHELRVAALALLSVTLAKVFLYDLSSLDSLYRVASFVALGALLLLGAFAWQRLRPPPSIR